MSRAPEVVFYRGKRVDEMSREELVRAVHELARAVDAERQSARHEREVLEPRDAAPRGKRP